MKLSDAFKVLLSLSLVTFTSPTVYAAGSHGGGDAGGGTEIEAGFKAKLVSISERALSMTIKQKAILRFDTDTLHSTLTMPGGLRPLCATGTELVQIKALNKMAYVFEPSNKIISLNCTDFSIADWHKLFNSEEPGATVFFLHEALRISPSGNLESDNDYSKSSSYTSALLVDANCERKIEAVLTGLNSQFSVALDPHTSRSDQAGILLGMTNVLDSLPVQEKIKLIDRLIQMANSNSDLKIGEQNTGSLVTGMSGISVVFMTIMAGAIMNNLHSVDGRAQIVALTSALVVAGMIVHGQMNKAEIRAHTFKMRSALINYKATLIAKDLLLQTPNK